MRHPVSTSRSRDLPVKHSHKNRATGTFYVASKTKHDDINSALCTNPIILSIAPDHPFHIHDFRDLTSESSLGWPPPPHMHRSYAPRPYEPQDLDHVPSTYKQCRNGLSGLWTPPGGPAKILGTDSTRIHKDRLERRRASQQLMSKPCRPIKEKLEKGEKEAPLDLFDKELTLFKRFYPHLS